MDSRCLRLDGSRRLARCASRLVEGMGLPLHLRVDVQRHFFRCFTMIEALEDETP